MTPETLFVARETSSSVPKVILNVIMMSLREFSKSRDYSIFRPEWSPELSALGGFQASSVDSFVNIVSRNSPL